MKTIILSSKSLNEFLVFETEKTPSELVEYMQAKDFSAEQAKIKELLFSSDLTAEISCKHTFKGNKQEERFNAITKMEEAGLVYLGANRGEMPVQGTAKAPKVIDTTYESDNFSGLSLPSSIFMGINQFVFWLMIIASVLIGYFGQVIVGVITALATVLSFGLLFMLSDLLKNTVEINRKLNQTPPK